MTVTKPRQRLSHTVALTLMLALAGCASGPGESIYVPIGGAGSKAPAPPTGTDQQAREQTEPRVWRKSEQPAAEPEREPEPRTSAPSYRDSGDELSPAAVSLIQSADSELQQGNAPAAIAQLERAQRIAPRSAEVYFKLAEAYVSTGQMGTAEQFALKGLSLAGRDVRRQRAGWLLLADIRRARGNVAGANQAEERAAAL